MNHQEAKAYMLQVRGVKPMTPARLAVGWARGVMETRPPGAEESEDKR